MKRKSKVVKVAAVLLALMMFHGGVSADSMQCREEKYQKLVEEKFIEPTYQKDFLVLLSREVITPEVAKMKCHSLVLEKGQIVNWLMDEKTGKKTSTADFTTFSPEKMMENTMIDNMAGMQVIDFEYKEDMPYLKIWIRNNGMESMQVQIVPKDGDASMVQDSFEVSSKDSQIIYYFADAQAKNKKYSIHIQSKENKKLDGIMAMKSFQKKVERKTGVYSPFGE